MAEERKRPLKVFLCHAAADKAALRALYRRLVRDGVDAWLDKENLLPGQDWRLEIPRAVQESDVVIICLSTQFNQAGFRQREVRLALDTALEQPEGEIFIIPARLEECEVPDNLHRWHWVDLFESHGYERLMRSLKLRADKLERDFGVTVSTDRELEQRLDQFYTEGLAAFYTEDWDTACRRFEDILREQPGHENAAEKLGQAERWSHLAKLYSQATEAYESENWTKAIKALEELLAKSGAYKDAVQLLKNASKQKQLKELYAEAKTLHTAEKWQAVVKVFEQITAIEPTYPDTEGLLISAQKEAAERRRLDQLNDLYRQSVREIAAGHWHEARGLLEQVHKAQTGFLETERLLRKVEDEITKIEKLEKQSVQINILYEQAHELVRSSHWHEALDKIQEIHKLNNQFEDKAGIAEKAKAALELEEEKVRRQNQLAAMYAEAVRLLKDEKYQEALDRWQEVKTIDAKYPDRHHVDHLLPIFGILIKALTTGPARPGRLCPQC